MLKLFRKPLGVCPQTSWMNVSSESRELSRYKGFADLSQTLSSCRAAAAAILSYMDVICFFWLGGLNLCFHLWLRGLSPLSYIPDVKVLIYFVYNSYICWSVVLCQLKNWLFLLHHDEVYRHFEDCCTFCRTDNCFYVPFWSGLGNWSRKEPHFFAPGAWAAWEKNKEPESLKRNRESEPPKICSS